MSQHATNGGDAARDIEEEGALDYAVGRLASRNVGVHFRKTRDQELATPVHLRTACGYLHLIGRSNSQNPVAPY
jgi:hypothetical protein